MNTNIAIKIVIVVRGASEIDAEDAFDEAVRLLQEGNLCGADSNDRSGFYFETKQLDEYSDEIPA